VAGNLESATKITVENGSQAAFEFDRKDIYLLITQHSSLGYIPCGTEIRPAVHTSVMAVILHGSGDKPQVWDLGAGYHSQIY